MHDGLVGTFSVAENLVLDLYDRAPFGRGLALDLERGPAATPRERVAEFDVRTVGIDAAASTLSGGNQQKVVLARELSRPLRLLVVAQPTRGLDVGRWSSCTGGSSPSGTAAPRSCSSPTELDEVLGLADRIVVMYRGRIIGELPAATAPRTIGLLMAGHDRASRARTTTRRGGRPDVGHPSGRATAQPPTTAPPVDRPPPRATRRAGASTGRTRRWSPRWRRARALVVGAVLIAIGGRGDARRRSATSSPRPGTPSASAGTPRRPAYVALFQGAILDPSTLRGDRDAILGPISETLLTRPR